MRRLRHAARSEQRVVYAQVGLGRHRELARGSNGVRETGKLRRVRLISRSPYPGLALRRLLLQRLFPGLRRRAGLWNQPAYSGNQESSSPRERVPEKSVPEKHASEAAAVESKTESQHKTGRSRKKRHRGGDIIFGGCAGDALENCQPEVLDSSRPAAEKARLWAEWRHVGTMVKLRLN